MTIIYQIIIPSHNKTNITMSKDKLYPDSYTNEINLQFD